MKAGFSMKVSVVGGREVVVPIARWGCVGWGRRERVGEGPEGWAYCETVRRNGERKGGIHTMCLLLGSVESARENEWG